MERASGRSLHVSRFRTRMAKKANQSGNQGISQNVHVEPNPKRMYLPCTTRLKLDKSKKAILEISPSD
ncbi:MAG: hypothetical protein HS132_17795 [Planctomycetia bacterium]|nr:hypothetical protein [Planctomycetia bacterium]